MVLGPLYIGSRADNRGQVDELTDDTAGHVKDGGRHSSIGSGQQIPLQEKIH
jgi:hypothetical protein